MKNETKDTVRVTVTFNRENDPAWVDTLNRMTNGRARAELLRRQLNPPPSLYLESPTTVKAAAPQAPNETVEPGLPPVVEAKPAMAAKRETTSEPKPAKPLKTTESNEAGGKKLKQRTRGALAGGMIASGKKTWE